MNTKTSRRKWNDLEHFAENQRKIGKKEKAIKLFRKKIVIVSTHSHP